MESQNLENSRQLDLKLSSFEYNRKAWSLWQQNLDQLTEDYFRRRVGMLVGLAEPISTGEFRSAIDKLRLLLSVNNVSDYVRNYQHPFSETLLALVYANIDIAWNNNQTEQAEIFERIYSLLKRKNLKLREMQSFRKLMSIFVQEGEQGELKDGTSWGILARVAQKVQDKHLYEFAYQKAKVCENHYPSPYVIGLVMEQSPSSSPIIVYQMGKVGSVAIEQSLLQLNLPNLIYHKHFLSWQGIAEHLQPSYSQSTHLSALVSNPSALSHLRNTYAEAVVRMRSVIDHLQGKQRWKIITLCREPVSWSISLFFQNIDYNLPGWDRMPPEELLERVTEYLLNGTNWLEKTTDWMAEWFDREIKSVFGCDVFAVGFNKKDGYQIYEAKNADILLIKFEKLTDCCQSAFREFLDIQDFELVRANVGVEKNSGQAYKRLLDKISIPENLLNKIYQSQYVQQFYAQKEIKSFKQRWLGKYHAPKYKVTSTIEMFCLGVVVWGKAYVNTFLNVCLPSQLSPNNLAYFSQNSATIYRIYTTAEDAEIIRRSTAYAELAAFVPVEIVYIEDLTQRAVVDHKYKTMTLCHADFVKKANAENSTLIFIYPDVVYADGTFTTLLKLAKAGKRLVLVPGTRLVQETFIPAYLSQYSHDEGSQAILPRQLVKLAMDHLHPITKAQMWGAASRDRFPGYLLWNVEQEGFIERTFVPSPFMVRPTQKSVVPIGSVDTDYIARVVSDLAEIHVVEDSDEICFFELSPKSLMDHAIENAPQSVGDVVEWARRENFSSLNWFFLKHRMYFHYDDVQQAQWAEAERQSDAIINSILAYLGDNFAYPPVRKTSLSVIIVAHNQYDAVNRTLEALLSQTFKPQEIIIVDDGSTDESVFLLEQLVQSNPALRLIRTTTQRGYTASINLAIKHASSDYIYCGSTEGGILPDFFEKSLSLLTQHSQAGLCHADSRLFDRSVRQNSASSTPRSLSPSYYSPDVIGKNTPEFSNLSKHAFIVRRSAMLEIGGFNKDLGIYAEWFVWLVLALRYGICHIPEILFINRTFPLT